MIIKQSFLFLASITFLSLFSSSCRSAKYLQDDQYLVTDVDVNGVPTDLKETAELYVANDIRPNSPLYLAIYNLFNTRNGKYKTDNIKNVGESPRILDSANVELSAVQIQRFLQTKGYFNAQVEPVVDLANKKARIDFNVEMEEPYRIRQIHRDVADPVVDSLYRALIAEREILHSGNPYESADLYAEREALYQRMREEGYFDYVRQYMRVGLDTIGLHQQADLHIQVANPDSAVRHQIYHIDSVYLRVEAPEYFLKKNTSRRYDAVSKINYLDETGKFRLKPLARYAFLRPGERFSSENEELSYDRLYEMNGFRSVKVNYQKKDSGMLDVYYHLVPRAAMSNQIEGEFTFSSGMSGFNIGNTFSHRNVFGGSETIEVKTRYGVLFDSRLPGSLRDKIFNNDFQIGVNVSFPRLVTPFRVRSVGRYGLPRTTFSSSLQLFFQDQTYANRYLINSLNYTWYEATNKMHSFTPVVVEYRDGRLNEQFKQNLIDRGYNLYVRSNDRQYFGLGAQYAYTHNAPKLTTKENFKYFRGAVDMSGNMLGLLSNVFSFGRDQDGRKLLFGVPYLQYIKGEVDFRWYRFLGGNRQLVFRVNSGLALPYGNNSQLLIFEKSFFAGGMNGIRAWQARTLGPGGYNRDVLDSDIRVNLRNLDQLGEIKFESNLEYRFRILNNFFGAKLNGASFLDVGNVWRLRKNDLNPNGEFRAGKILTHMAVGTGFGLRADLDYFVIRLDAGLKVKDPQFQGKDQWVIQHLFASKDFKEAYYQRHHPDRYNFIQYNFGVGMPF